MAVIVPRNSYRNISYTPHSPLPTPHSPLPTPHSINQSIPFSANPAGELHVLGHDGDALGVDRTHVGVLKEANDVGLGGLLQGKEGGGLEPQVGPKILGNLADELLEGTLADHEIGGLLVLADLAEGDCSRTVPAGLLDSTGSGRTGGFGGELFPRSLSSSGFTSGLFSASHC